MTCRMARHSLQYTLRQYTFERPRARRCASHLLKFRAKAGGGLHCGPLRLPPLLVRWFVEVVEAVEAVEAVELSRIFRLIPVFSVAPMKISRFFHPNVFHMGVCDPVWTCRMQDKVISAAYFFSVSGFPLDKPHLSPYLASSLWPSYPRILLNPLESP